MEKTIKSTISKDIVTAIMNSSNELMTAIKEDEVLMSVFEMLYNTTVTIENIINNYEGDNACINISVDNLTDIELFCIGCFKSDVIDYCNYHKPQYELIDIELFDDVTILKVKI